MPWSEITPMSQRLEFVRLVQQGEYTVAELCTIFGVSEKTAYKWLRRFRIDGVAGLADRSHAPHQPAHQLSAAVIGAIVALRTRHPGWGPKKLRAALSAREPDTKWPAASTIGELLDRRGLVLHRRRRGPTAHAPWKGLHGPLHRAQEPNDVWTADFKGHFRLRSGAYCYPLTVLDARTRYLLECRALPSTALAPVHTRFLHLFRTFGLPRVIRTDNGVPFAGVSALAGLSTLAVWWIRLGIRPERIAPGQPQQNGQHERLHKTLKAEATKPPSPTMDDQQRRFMSFQREYNQDRPHEALGQQPPASQYEPSPRRYPRRLPSPTYPVAVDLRRVSSLGTIYMRGQSIFLSTTLEGEHVAIEETNNDEWRIRFGDLQLGHYHDATQTFTPGCLWLNNQNL